MKERQRVWIPESLRPPMQPIIDMPSIQLDGYYYVDLIDAKTGEVKQHLEFSNLITDAGLNFIGSGTPLNSIYNLLSVGTSNTTPTVSDVALGGKIASSSNGDGQADTDGFQTSPVEFAFRRRIRVFLEEEANGNLRELGWEFGGVIANRTLFKDLKGNPTTVIKTNLDILKVVYEYRVFAPLNDVTGTFSFAPGSASVGYTIRPQNVGTANGWGNLVDNMGSYSTPEARVHEANDFLDRTLDNNPSPQASEDTSSFGGYTAGTFFKDMEYQWNFATANFGSNVNLVTWNPWNSAADDMVWQMHLSSSIEKNINTRLNLIFRQRWTRK